MRSKLGEMTNFDWEIPIDDDGNLVLYAHTFASALEPTCEVLLVVPHSTGNPLMDLMPVPDNNA